MPSRSTPTSTSIRRSSNGLVRPSSVRYPRDPWVARARADPRSGIQRRVSYLVRSTPSGNVRVSTSFRFTQLSRAVKNGVPPPTRTGWVTIAYSSISPARMAAAARVAPPTSMGPPSSVLSRVISVTASPVTRRVFQSPVLVVEENTTFGMSRQRRGGAAAARGGAGGGGGGGAGGGLAPPT